MVSQSLPAAARWAGQYRERAAAGLLAQRRCLQVVLQAGLGPVVLFFLAVVSVLMLTRPGGGPAVTLLGLGAAIAWPIAFFWWSRAHSARSRRWARDWFGLVIPERYRVIPAPTQDERGHWWTGHSYYRQKRTAESALFVREVTADPETWRDVRWLVGNAVAAALLALPTLGLLAFGAAMSAAQLLAIYAHGGMFFVQLPVIFGQFVQLLFALGLAAGGLAVAPYALRTYGEWMHRALDPQASGKLEKVRLTQRVEHLTTTRAEAVGSQVAELRRIERDLHDGAQARLVAIGMTLGTIEHLMDSDPSSARRLLAEARESSAKALQELRDLVRGIHPPVLAERGLGDAVRELALDSALNTEVTVSLPARPEAPVESAAYFCVSELLANVAKHSGAQLAWVDILFRAGQLRITVTDDGRGGAVPERGSGLRGIERRLGTFDGVLSLSSPPGGPTTITMELPCALSSPRTSTSSEKA
ncbi:sensor histidine kinase [Kitasatospora sp. MAP5-34]|uniref:sensor histidine kinase n=1 Tax=Kitasatospora sp. MAP5-34 TaxID=3035102 RepID=UPI002476659E|nr:sensor histidine kinase [Kitasatospora sp. MAP5-34]MDH6579690.1 signal transduction histidine kinase [Kitasatospora sp. MAP5-34]